ncbi:MAG: DUF6580 family putative transport protein [Bacteroidota bacterium]
MKAEKAFECRGYVNNETINNNFTIFAIYFNYCIMKINGRLILFTIILIALATACKFFFGPSLSWSGFSPVIAIALFAGFIIKQKDISFMFPLLALLISDVVIQGLYENNLFPYAGIYSGQWKNYLILLSATVVGLVLKGRKRYSLIVGAIAAPTIFFPVVKF